MSGRILATTALAAALIACPLVAHADASDPFTAQPQELQRQVAAAEAQPVVPSKKSPVVIVKDPTAQSPVVIVKDPAKKSPVVIVSEPPAKKSPVVIVGQPDVKKSPVAIVGQPDAKKSPVVIVSEPDAQVTSATGTYPTRRGVILVTPDFFKGLIPTGHSAIINTPSEVIESNSRGVIRGANNWNTTRSQAYGVEVKQTTVAQDSLAVDWAIKQLGKPYNYNYFNRDTRSSFYCSQLVWAAFKDNFNIDLDTWAFGAAVHPMELVNTDKTSLIYRKK